MMNLLYETHFSSVLITTQDVSGASYLLPAAVTTELGSSVFQSRPSLEHRSWLSFEPATTDTSFSTSRNTDGSMLTYTQTRTHTVRA